MFGNRRLDKGLVWSGMLLALFVAGCGGKEERVVATEPQAQNQQARSRQQEVEVLTKLLTSEDEGKVKRGLYWLKEYAADSDSAVPTLEKVAQTHANEAIKTEAKETLEKIKSAKAPK